MMRSAVVIAAVGLLAAGCGSQTPKAPAPPAVADASRVNMCTVMTSAELTGLGVRPETRQGFSKAGVIGCRWLGNPYIVSLERADNTLAQYQASRNDPKFVTFVDNKVNDRAGAHFGVDRNGSQCAQLMDGGPVALSVSVAVSPNVNPRPIDPCAEALRIAQIIEPRLPKAAK
jgi:uncharacterized protein DUF3558